jgi:hypothetical protein
MHFHIAKMYKDKEVNKNVKNNFFINVWRKIFLTFASLGLVLLWQLFYLFCSSIVINTVIVTAGTFGIPRTNKNAFKTLGWIRVIAKLPNSEQSYKGKVKTHKYIKLWKRNDPDLVQAFLKKWWVESDFKAPNLFQVLY